MALLGAGDFDVRDVDVTTLAFGPDAASPVQRAHRKDVDGDGYEDLVLHFRSDLAGIDVGDARVCLTGALRNSTPFEGCDAVQTVPTGPARGAGGGLTRQSR